MSATSTDREQALSEAFVDLADTLVDDYDVIEMLHRLALHCVRLLPIDAAGLMLSDQRGSLEVVSSSTEQARVVELFQLEAQEGPCLECFRDSTPVSASDLTLEIQRWPLFAPRAVEQGFRAVWALPLRLRTNTVGSLTLFGAASGALPEHDLRLAKALADAATISILHERTVRQHELLAEQLQAALNSRVIIEQAKGVLAERSGLDMTQAFAALRGHARRTNQRLSMIAQGVVDGSQATEELLRRLGQN